jgi:hypothetical protein
MRKMQILKSSESPRLPNFGCALTFALVHTQGETPFDAWEAGVLLPGEIQSLRYLGRDELADPEQPHDVWEANVSDGTFGAKLFVAQPCEDALAAPAAVEACEEHELGAALAYHTGLSQDICERICRVWAGVTTGFGFERQALWQTRHGDNRRVFGMVVAGEFGGKVVGFWAEGPEGRVNVEARTDGLFVLSTVELPEERAAAAEAIAVAS